MAMSPLTAGAIFTVSHTALICASAPSSLSAKRRCRHESEHPRRNAPVRRKIPNIRAVGVRDFRRGPRSRSGHVRHSHHFAHDGFRSRRRLVRGRLGFRHGRSVHRNHSRSPTIGTGSTDCPDVPRPTRPDNPGVGTCPTRARTTLRTTGGATHCRPGQTNDTARA